MSEIVSLVSSLSLPTADFLMVNAPPQPSTPLKLSKLEGLKERSHHLRYPLTTELQTAAKNLPEDAIQILKFHGSYQQDNRDHRVKGQEKDYQFMLRTRSPGGFIPPQLYLALDELSETYGNQTLRITTRQGFQIHGVLKQNLKTVIATIIHNMGSTLGACGDLNRNVMAPPAPYTNRPAYTYAKDYANRIADLLTPQNRRLLRNLARWGKISLCRRASRGQSGSPKECRRYESRRLQRNPSTGSITCLANSRWR